MLWFNYVASFSDGVQKVGVTSQPFHRIQDCILEAQRHDLRINGFSLSGPSATKRIALDVNRYICEMNMCTAVAGHTSWFAYGEADNRTDMPDFLFGYLERQMKARWQKLNPVRHKALVIVRCTQMLEFAMELGTNGAPIKAALAAELGNSLVRDHDVYRKARAAAHDKWVNLPPSESSAAFSENSRMERDVRAARVHQVLA